ICVLSYFSVSISFFFSTLRRHPCSTLFPYTTLFRSLFGHGNQIAIVARPLPAVPVLLVRPQAGLEQQPVGRRRSPPGQMRMTDRSEEHTSELQSRFDLVCRLLLEKKKKNNKSIKRSK